MVIFVMIETYFSKTRKGTLPGNWSEPQDGIIVVPLGHTCIINSSLIRDACPIDNSLYDE